MVSLARKRRVIVLLTAGKQEHWLRFDPADWRKAIEVLARWHVDYGILDLESAKDLADEVERIGLQCEQPQQQKSVLDKVAEIGKEMFARFLKGQ
jgi:hypothetical protein